jgi:hypothetical protein
MDIETDDIVLIGGRDKMWEGCLLRVEEIRPWGVIGSVRSPGPAEYPLRLNLADIAAVYRRR